MKIFLNNLQDVSMTEDKFDMDVRNVRLFHDDTFPSFYRRLDFSPDGKYETQLKHEMCKLFHLASIISACYVMLLLYLGELLVVPSGVLDVEGETSDAPHCTLIFCTSNYSK